MNKVIWCNYPMPDGHKVFRRISPEVCEWHRQGGWGQKPDIVCEDCEYVRDRKSRFR
ncbi:MAG: hypothetical protein ABIG61_05600 [Planctomycetota bacterium]